MGKATYDLFVCNYQNQVSKVIMSKFFKIVSSHVGHIMYI